MSDVLTDRSSAGEGDRVALPRLALPRRTWLHLAGLTIAVVGCGDDGATEPASPPACAGSDAPPVEAVEPENVEAITTWILDVEEARLVVELEAHLASDWTVDAVAAAMLLLGSRRIDSVLGGGGFHAAIQVDALRFFHQRAPAPEQLAPIVYGLLLLRQIIAAETFALPAIDEASVPRAEGARERLVASVVAGALDDALREVTALGRADDRAALFDVMIELGLRRTDRLAHTAIFTAKALRLLRELPGAWSEDVLRAWVVMLLNGAIDPAGAPLWDASREASLALPCGWEDLSDDPGAIPTIVRAFRGLEDPLDAIALVEAQLGAGVSTRSLWDGLVLTACEKVHGGANYHALTVVQAVRDLHLLASNARTRLLALLQGAVFAVEVVRQEGTPPPAPLLDLAPPIATADEAFLGFGRQRIELALGHLQHGGDAAAFQERMALLARSRAFDEHHYKIPQAALIEVERVDPAWRHHVLAVTRAWAPSTGDEINAAWSLLGLSG